MLPQTRWGWGQALKNRINKAKLTSRKDAYSVNIHVINDNIRCSSYILKKCFLCTICIVICLVCSNIQSQNWSVKCMAIINWSSPNIEFCLKKLDKKYLRTKQEDRLEISQN